MKTIISDWHLLKTDAEIEIIKKHSNFGRFYTLFFARKIIFDEFIYIYIYIYPVRIKLYN